MEKPEAGLFLQFLLTLISYGLLKLRQLVRSLSLYKRLTVRGLIWRRGQLFRPAAHLGVASLALLAVVGGAVFGPLPSLATQPQLAAAEVVATPTVVQTDIPQDRPRPATVEHIVVADETLSSLAAQFNVSVDSIKWASSLSSDNIAPGQKLLIPPVTGIVHTVTKGETLAAVAKTYGVTTDSIKTWAFNDVPDDNALEEGQILVLPGGRPAEIVNPPTYRARVALAQAPARRPTFQPTSWSNNYPFGQCTWWVAQKRYVPWIGNARDWYYAATAFGYRVGKTPAPGAIMVTTGNSWLGHVAYVEKVTKDGVVISEMNSYVAGGGWGRVDTRTVVPGRTDIVIGYIY